MTSPRSTRTHSASRSPSTPSGITPHFFANCTASSAQDFTWRVEVPEAITRKSAMLVLPRTSISTTSFAFISSSAACTCASRASGVGAGTGIRVLMTWALLVKLRSRGRRMPVWTLYPRARTGPVQAVAADVARHRRRQHPFPVAAPGDAPAHLRRRFLAQGADRQRRVAPRGAVGERPRFAPARRQFLVHLRRRLLQPRRVRARAGAFGAEHVREFEDAPPLAP